MKMKVISFLLVLTMVFTLHCVALAENDSAKIVISMDDAPVQVGDKVTVSVSLEDITAKKYFASEVVLYFNPTVLKCIEGPKMSSALTESGVMGQIYKKVDEKKGLACCAIGMLPESYLESGLEVSTGKLELFTVSFEVIGQGDVNLQVASKESAPAYEETFPSGAKMFLGSPMELAELKYEKVSYLIGEKGDALISEILPIDAITVPYGTENIDEFLPGIVSVKLDDGSVKEFGMNWTGYLSSYDGTIPGTYLFRGTLQEVEGYNNHLGLFSLLEVTVTPEDGTEEIVPQPEQDNESEGSTEPELPVVSFADLDTVPWAADKIVALATNGIVSGLSEGIFDPNGEVTRGQFVAMLTRAFGLLEEDADCDFSDVAKGEWYYTAVASAKKHGITAGYEDNTFRPNALITRQEMAAMAYRTAEIAGLTIPDITDKLIFTDEEQISDYAKEAITAMQMGGVINGMGDGCFGPEENATRAQAAVIIYQLYQLK